MALQLKQRRPLISMKLAGAFLAVFALFVQPLVMLNMPAAFAVADTPAAPTITKPSARQWFKTTPIQTQWSSVSDPSGIDYYQVAYSYDDGHTFGGSDCPTVTAIDGKVVSGCRNVNGVTRNHSPELNEEGGVTIWVRAIDGAGNVGEWSDSVHYYYDHTDPTTNIVAPTGVVGNSFTVSGDAEDKLSLNRIYVQLDKLGGGRYGGTTINLIGQGTDAHWSKTFDADALNLPDGDYRAHVTVTDMAGNTASAGWTSYFTVDSRAPTVSNVRVGNPIGGTTEVRAKINDPNGINLALGKTHVRFFHGSSLTNGAAASSANVKFTYDDVTDDYIASIDTTTFADNGSGIYWVYIRAEDNLGNAVGNDDTRGVAIDNVDPTVTLNASPSTSPTNQEVTVSRQVNDANFDYYTHCVMRNTAEELSDCDEHRVDTSEVNTTYSAHGDYRVVVKAWDTLGNYTEKTLNFTIDTERPVLSSLTAVQNDDNTFTLSVVTNDPATVKFVIDGVEVPGASGQGNDPWIWSVTTIESYAVNTRHDFSASSVDSAGNETTKPGAFFVQPPETTTFDDDSTPFSRQLAGVTTTPTADLFATTGSDTAVSNEGDSDEGEVLGTQNSSSPAENVALAPSDQGWKLWGVAWYWWLLAAAAFAGIWWMIAAWRRRQAEADPSTGL